MKLYVRLFGSTASSRFQLPPRQTQRAGVLQAGFCEGEAHNGAGSNTVTLSRPKGESNGEHKADLNTGGCLSTRPQPPIQGRLG